MNEMDWGVGLIAFFGIGGYIGWVMLLLKLSDWVDDRFGTLTSAGLFAWFAAGPLAAFFVADTWEIMSR